MNFVPPAGTDAKVAAMMKNMMPTTVMMKTLKELKTDDFDISKVSLPKGATKFQRK